MSPKLGAAYKAMIGKSFATLSDDEIVALAVWMLVAPRNFRLSPPCIGLPPDEAAARFLQKLSELT